jgi:hypothetical protein
MNLQPISNDVDDFSSPAFGPEQADVKVLSCEYISFDYKGTIKDDPIVAVQMNCEPTDGSNDSKNFTIEWPTGAKMSEVAIMDGGGQLVPKSTSTRKDLHNNSNWALCLKSMKDCGFDTRLLNGDSGINCLKDAEFTFKQVPQPTREGLSTKTDKGFDKKYYTCLKILAMPGETKKGRKAAGPKAAPAASSQAAPAAASSNGNSSITHAAVIQQALKTGGGVLPIATIKDACFHAAKALGMSVKDAFAISKECAEENNYLEAVNANKLDIQDNTIIG